jgi:hypothetical protein
MIEANSEFFYYFQSVRQQNIFTIKNSCQQSIIQHLKS